jgi:hypothetical protein
MSNRGDRKMRKFFAVAVGSMVALVGFAGAANAGATVELLWLSTGTDTIESVAIGSEITLEVVITGGPEGVTTAGVSVDFADPLTAGSIEFVRTTCIANSPFQFCPGDPAVTESQVNSITVSGFSGALLDGETVQMGTVTFLKIANPDGTFTFPVGVLVGTDGIFDANLQAITDNTFVPAFLVNVPEPGAISMLVMGLGGVLLAGRGRRS